MYRIIKISLLLLLIISVQGLFGQTTTLDKIPNGIAIQSVARDANGNAASNRNIYLKVELRQGTATGEAVLLETHTVTSNDEGIFNFYIGQGIRVSGVNSLIFLDWKGKIYFLNIKMAIEPSLPTPGWVLDKEYVDLGTSQIWSVPYAFTSYRSVIADSAFSIAGILAGVNGGTGVSNVGKTITLGRNFEIQGLGNLKFNTTGPTTLTLPLKGTLVTSESLDTLINKYLLSPTFLGSPKTPTPDIKSNDSSVASTQFVKSVISSEINTLNTKLSTTLDTTAGAKLKIADTSVMLSKRIERDTASLSNRINLKVNTLNASIDSSLYVNGLVTIDSVVTINDSLNVKGQARFDSLLTIYDSLRVKGNVLIDTNLTVNKITTLNDSLIVKGGARIDQSILAKSKLYVSDSVIAKGNVKIDNNLNVGKVASLNDSLYVKGQARFDSLLTINDSLRVKGNVLIDTNLTVGKDLEIKGNLILNRGLDFNDSLIVQKGARIEQSILDKSKLYVSDSILAKGNVKIDNNLIVAKVTSLNDSLYVKGQARFDSLLTINDSLRVKGNVLIDTNLTVGKDLEVKGNLILNSGLQFNDSLIVSKGARIEQSILAKSKLYVSDSILAKGNVKIDNNLNVNKVTSLNDSLYVKGQARFDSLLTINDSLRVKGNVLIDSNLTVLGRLSLSTALQFNDSLIVSKGARIDQSILAKSKLYVSDSILAKGNVLIDNNLNVTKVTSLNDSLYVKGQARFDSLLTINDSLRVKGNVLIDTNLTVNKITTLNDSLIVKGGARIDLSILAKSKLFVTDSIIAKGNVLIDNNLNVTKVTSLNDSLFVKGQARLDSLLTINDSLRVKGNVLIDTNLTVKRTTTLNDSLIVKGGLRVDQNILAKSKLTVTDSILAKGNMKIDGVLTVNGLNIYDSIMKYYTGKLNVNDTSAMLLAYLTKINDLYAKNAETNSDVALKLYKSDTSSLSNRINLKVTAADTAAWLNSRFARDTASLSKRIDSLRTGSGELATTKLNISDSILFLRKTDTAAMLSKRIQRDTANLSRRLDLLSDQTFVNNNAKLNITDTSKLLQKKDTITLSNRIDAIALSSNVFTSDITLNMGSGKTFGKYANGETILSKGKSIDEVIFDIVTKAISPTYSGPSLTLSMGYSGNIEIGTNLGTLTFVPTYTQNDVGNVTSISYKKNTVELTRNTGTPIVTDNLGTLSSTTTYEVVYNYGAGTTVKKNNLGVDDPTGMKLASSISASVTLTPISYRYWGMTTNSSASITDADIRAMVGGSRDYSSSKLKTEFTITGPGGAGPVKYAYYAVPHDASGTITSIKAGGFESIAAFDVITRDFVNALGYTVSYDIYVQKNSGTDNVTLIIN